MALLPSITQIPAQRVSLNETPSAPVYTSREWYRFFDSLHTYTPTPANFTPAFTAVSNVTAITAGAAFYTQMGTVVTLTGTFTLDPTTTGDTVFRMTPPVLEDLSLSTAAGVFVSTASGASDVGSVVASGSTLQFRLNAASAAAATYAFTINYQIA
jgi:hypothetical protein